MTLYLVTAEAYDELHREEQYAKYKCLAELTGESLGRLLDIGCGTGLFYEYAEARNLEFEVYVCLDPYEEYLVKAASKMRRDPRVILVQGYAEDLPFRSAYFTTVISVSTWGAIEGRESALLEAKRVLNNHGIAVFTGYPRTYSKPPTTYDPEFQYKVSCIDEFYAYEKSRN